MNTPGSDRITGLLTTFLDVQSKRAEVVAGNLANAETPGYKARELNFEEFLQRAATDALLPARPGEISTTPGAPQVVEQSGDTARLDGNTVDAGREMASLSDAGLKYLTGAQLLQSRFRTLRSAIRDSR